MKNYRGRQIIIRKWKALVVHQNVQNIADVKKCTLYVQIRNKHKNDNYQRTPQCSEQIHYILEHYKQT